MWTKSGCILKPTPSIAWLSNGAGPCFARIHPDDHNIAQLYVTGRDSKNRSNIGMVTFDLRDEKVLDISAQPVMPLGEKGSFDENGTSYPYIVSHDGKDYLYYTGWIQGVQVRWYNDLGVAVSTDGVTFKRISRAPLPLRNDADFIGIGSTCVIKHKSHWHMWYTRFDRWGYNPGDHEHYYNIKHAISADGIDWKTNPEVCIDFSHPDEYAIAKPCVMWIRDRFVMWYSYRGDAYRAGLAISPDGQQWRRLDERVGIMASADGWDSDMLCYPFVLARGEDFFMFYNGNGYGASGLGLARTERSTILEMINV
jgi:hypothetical protein